MASKLFSAVVGIGITLGSTTGACVRTVDVQDDNAGGGDSGRASETDAPSDAPTLSAFCDAAWPTTKGNNDAGATCGATEACHEAGASPHCHTQLAAGACETAEVPAWCVDGAWRCATGSVPVEACR